MKERSYDVESGSGQKRLNHALPKRNADAASQTCLAAAPHRRGDPQDAAGLSKLHNVTKPPCPVTLTYYEGASLVDIQGPRRSAVGKEGPGTKRNGILDWSPASRGRLKETCAKIDRVAMDKALLLTMTYPKEHPPAEEFRIYKNHLRVFNQALCRRFPGASGIWKQEFQERGAVHFHTILLGAGGESLEILRTWITAKWYAIAHNGDVHEGKAACNVDPIKSKGGAMSYMAKYIGKGNQTKPGYSVGRYWGTFGGQNLPLAAAKTLELTPAQLIRVRRMARRKIEADMNNTRWRQFFDNRNPRKPAPGQSGQCKNPWALGGRNFWEQAKSAFHGGARCFRSLDWRPPHKYNDMMFLGGWVETWTSTSVVLDYRPPSKWKARRNDRVRVFCDASAFVLYLQRALDAGIL